MARIISALIAMMHRSSGTSFVGLIVLKICPKFLRYCSDYVKKDIIAVTGTNGKTTTAGLISCILENDEQKVVHNEKGANMLTGITNALALKLAPCKRFDYYVLESDEAYLTKMYDYLPSNKLLVTNLFRDQLDRYGELDTTAKKIQSAIDKNTDLKLFLNADDPMVANLGSNVKNRVFFGFDKIEIVSNPLESNAPVEVVNCPICGEALKYNDRFFAQQGHYYCDCGYQRPHCDYCADVKIFNEYSILSVKNESETLDFKVSLIGLYNAYNALASIAIALDAGYDQNKIQNALNNYQPIFGRAEKLLLNGHQVLVQLIKNPTGASEALKTVDLNTNPVIIINDNYADGRDVSWLWDADFEYLRNVKNPIIVSGHRAKDMAVRLKYAGIDSSKIIVIPKIRHAIRHVLTKLDINEKITILPTYTALLKMQSVIRSQKI
ncbi:Mur ligase family protein [bacterium]|nr:Mur ligase family protein [bacterium]